MWAVAGRTPAPRKVMVPKLPPAASGETEGRKHWEGVRPAPSLLQELTQDVDQNDDDDQPYQEAYCLVHPLSFLGLSDFGDHIPTRLRSYPFSFDGTKRGPEPPFGFSGPCIHYFPNALRTKRWGRSPTIGPRRRQD